MDNLIAARTDFEAADLRPAIAARSPADGARLVGLDWLRGVAALWVLVYHLNITIQKPKYFGAESFGPLAELGYHGVDLFFVLSGFVMAASTPTTARGDVIGMKNFFVRRVMRIFPAYLVVTIPLMAMAFLTGVGAPETTPLDAKLVVSNLLLLPRDDLASFVPVVSWTLTHELMFYLLFSLTFISFRIALVALTLWSTACLAVYAAGGPPPGWLMQLGVVNIYFLAGVLTCHLSARVAGFRAAAAVLSVVFLVAAGVLETGLLSIGTARPVVQAICYGAAFTLLIFSVAKVAARSGAGAKVLDVLGRQSYSIYLVHYPIIVIVAMVLTAIGAPAPVAAIFVLSLTGTLVASVILYRLVEQPAINLGRRLTRSRPG